MNPYVLDLSLYHAELPGPEVEVIAVAAAFLFSLALGIHEIYGIEADRYEEKEGPATDLVRRRRIAGVVACLMGVIALVALGWSAYFNNLAGTHLVKMIEATYGISDVEIEYGGVVSHDPEEGDGITYVDAGGVQRGIIRISGEYLSIVPDGGPAPLEVKYPETR